MRCAVVLILVVSIVTMARPAGAQVAEHIERIDPAMLPRFDVASIKPSPADWKADCR
jgi:hypothetical protein